MMEEKAQNNIFPRLLIVNDLTSYIVDPEHEKKALHEAIEIKYFIFGSSTLLIGDQTVKAKAGDLIVVNPYEFHATIANGQEKGHYHMLIVPLEYFSGETIDDLNLKQMLLEKRMRLQNHFQANAEMESCILRIMRENTEKKPFHHMIIRSLLSELFGLLLREGAHQQGENELTFETLRTYQSIEPALRYIRDHYRQTVSLDHLAALCRLSKHYFCRLFKSIIGKTAMEYVREYRMKVAYSMLESTDKKILQIAQECGFPDDNYFCRCYRQHYGISPGKYREQIRKEREYEAE